jgi:bacterioferritin
MKGHGDVIQVLNDVLCAELTAINQYFIHAMMNHKHSKEESVEEMQHAQQLIERILYLEGTPNMQKYMKINVGKDVPEQHQLDLALEKDAVERLNKGLELCREKGDNGSRLLLEKILAAEEEHIDWIEAQLEQIKTIGIENYLAQQIDG